ncbi:hypothetical protein BGX28_006035 [Mortierella sp. GBA30]|nr:hypothetical protein BGX28_006035 [Mortierella sp. GBA30]
MSKVFADEEQTPQSGLPDLSMEMTLLIVKRCIKEIRERGNTFTIAIAPPLTSGLTTKGILRQVQMGQSQKVIIDTIRMILDDDVSTELSPLQKVDIHLVAHAMKWAIRYSEETLVTYDDYQTLYLNQDRNFSRFVHELPPTNRAILLDLFSLCADVTLLAHLNNMTLVSVAKAISLSIMAEPEREFTTFDASLQQRNLWGAACEDLLRAFLRIKTTNDLARIEQEDEVDENRYICNETRVLKSARQRATGGDDHGRMPNNVNLPSRLDISLPSSAGSSIAHSAGWPINNGPMSACTPRSYANVNGYFDNVPGPHSASPYSQHGGMHESLLSRSHSLAKSNASNSRPLSPAAQFDDDVTEYEELMQQQANFGRARQDPNNLLRPAEPIRRRSSVTDLENLYLLPMDMPAPTDGYESDPEVSHPHEPEEPQDSLIPDFADGLGWDFAKEVGLQSKVLPSLTSFQSRPENKCGVNRSNSASSNGSGIGLNGPGYTGSPRSVRDQSKQQLQSTRLRQMHEQCPSGFPPLHRARSQQDLLSRDSPSSPSPWDSPPPGSIQRSSSASVARAGHIQPSHQHPQTSQHSPTKRNSGLRRSISLDPFTTHGRIHKKPNDLQSDLETRDNALRMERDLVAEDIRMQLLKARDVNQQDQGRRGSEFALESSPQDLEWPPVSSSRRPSIAPTDERPVSSSRRPSLLPTDERPLLPAMLSRRPSLLSTDERPCLSAASSRRPSLLSTDERHAMLRRPSLQPMDNGFGSKSMLQLNMDNLPSFDSFGFESMSSSVTPRSVSPFDQSPLHPLQQESDAVSLSPRAELRFKFQETVSDHSTASPPGYAHAQNAFKNGSGAKLSASSSTVSSPRQLRQGANRTTNTPPTQSNSVTSSNVSRNRSGHLSQSVTFSGVSTTSSLPSTNGEGGKSKTPGFIRALSSKLRSKQSDDQLRTVRINSQVVGSTVSTGASTPTTGVPTMVAPSVSIEPPRLELNFLDDVISPAAPTAATVPGLSSYDYNREQELPPASAPALMLDSRDGGPGAVGGWKREAQNVLLITSEKPYADEEQAGLDSGAGRDHPDFQPKGFSAGVRRATVFGSGNISLREQHRSRKVETSSSCSSDSLPQMDVVAQKDVKTIEKSAEAVLLDQERQPTDDADESSIPKKTAADETEIRFSAATLLKDGKLYYQLQWDQFSEVGFKAPERNEMTEPEQNPDGIHHQPQLSQEDPWMQSGSSATTVAAMTAMTNHQQQQQQPQQQQQMKPLSATTTNSGSISLDLPGQIGQVSMSKKAAKLMGLMESQDHGPSEAQKEVPMPKKAAKLMGLMESQDHAPSEAQKEVPMPKKAAKLMGLMETQNHGPSEAQKAAAVKAAKETFMAIARDPKALAALKAGTTGGAGQPTIIGTGSFPKGSTIPRIELNPLIMQGQTGSNASLENEDGFDILQGSMSDRLSPISSVTVVASSPGCMTKTQPGSAAVGGGGAGSSVSLSSAEAVPRRDNGSSLVEADSTTGKAKGGSRLFGKKFRSSKKKSISGLAGVTQSVEAATLPSVSNGGKAGRKKRLLPAGVRRQDVMTKTIESMDEVFPWMCIEHMAGQESGWVMLEPVQDGAVGWVVVDKLDDEMGIDLKHQPELE